jgi:hypothetical protein
VFALCASCLLSASPDDPLCSDFKDVALSSSFWFSSAIAMIPLSSSICIVSSNCYTTNTLSQQANLLKALGWVWVCELNSAAHGTAAQANGCHMWLKLQCSTHAMYMMSRSPIDTRLCSSRQEVVSVCMDHLLAMPSCFELKVCSLFHPYCQLHSIPVSLQ